MTCYSRRGGAELQSVGIEDQLQHLLEKCIMNQTQSVYIHAYHVYYMYMCIYVYI